MQGDPVVLDCLANGYPLPVPSWSKATSPSAKAVQDFRIISQVLPDDSYRYKSFTCSNGRENLEIRIPSWKVNTGNASTKNV